MNGAIPYPWPRPPGWYPAPEVIPMPSIIPWQPDPAMYARALALSVLLGHGSVSMPLDWQERATEYADFIQHGKRP